MIGQVDLDKLEAIARAATPGPWVRGDRWHIQGAAMCECRKRIRAHARSCHTSSDDAPAKPVEGAQEEGATPSGSTGKQSGVRSQ